MRLNESSNVRSPFSNLHGVSTGLHLAANEQLSAALALFTPIDVVHDLIQPGGIVCSSFVEDYTGLTEAFERFGTPLRHMLKDFAYDWQLLLGVSFFILCLMVWTIFLSV